MTMRSKLIQFGLTVLIAAAWLPSAFGANVHCVDAFRTQYQYGQITLSKPLPAKKDLSLGFYFGTFDPLHEGHVAVMQRSLDSGLDAVIAIPNFLTGHKPNATSREHRVAMAIARTEPVEGISLMLDDGGSSAGGSKDGPVLALIDAVKPKETTLLIGDDSFVGMLERIELSEVPFDRIQVFSRGKTNFKIPLVKKPVVEQIDLGSGLSGLSSTQIRSARIKGEVIPSEILHPSIQSYIERNGLYLGE